MRRLDPGSPMGRLTAERPEILGNLVWPYQCAAWGPGMRFDRIEGHLDALEEIPGLKLAADEKLLLADLADISTGAALIIDRPPWLAREGQLTLSLFKDRFRAFSLSFSLLRNPDLQFFIGGIQGRQTSEILTLYRDLTKDFHGVRPRDFMLESLRMLAVLLDVAHIFAVADEQKISRHPYFGKTGPAGLFYDEIWQERGGVRSSETHFELPVSSPRRDLAEVSAKKRPMYRRRYEMLDQIAARLPTDLSKAERKLFDAQ